MNLGIRLLLSVISGYLIALYMGTGLDAITVCFFTGVFIGAFPWPSKH